MVRLVATLPCHNEAHFLEPAINRLKKENEKLLNDFLNDYIIVIAEDGSTDGSAEIASKLAAQDSKILHIHADEKLGRGRALINAWKKVNGDIYAYIDCDLATDMHFYPQLIRYINDSYDLSTGSRYLKDSNCNRPILRRFFSIIYNTLTRSLFHDGIYDHQCGFKAFSKKLVTFIVRENLSNGWFWDTETIVIAKKNGFKVIEFCVNWEEKKGKRTPMKRLIKDFWIHGKGLIHLFLQD